MPIVFLSSSSIILGSILAFFWPYLALQVSTFSLYILALITLMAYWDFDFKIETIKSELSLKKLLFAGFTIFAVVPLIQWYLAYFIVEDKALRLGLYLSSICPPALIIPFFVRNNKTKLIQAQHFILMFTFIFPFLMFFLLQMMAFKEFQISLKNLFIDIFSVTAVPILFLYLLRKIKKSKFQTFSSKIRQTISIVFIGVLTFCYIGVAFAKSNFATISYKDIAALVILVIFQDFGIYYLMNYILKYFEKNNDFLLSVQSSLRNVALAGYVLMFYLPKAAIAPALVMLVHSVYFIFLDYKSKVITD